MTTPNHARYEALLVKASDGLLDEAESEALFAHVEACAACREELEGFRRLKEMTDMLRQRLAKDARLEPARESPAARRWTLMMTTSVILGVLLLGGYGAYAFIREEPPTLVLIAVIVASLGIAGLIARPLLSRLTHARHDPYQEIDQ